MLSERFMFFPKFRDGFCFSKFYVFGTNTTFSKNEYSVAFLFSRILECIFRNFVLDFYNSGSKVFFGLKIFVFSVFFFMKFLGPKILLGFLSLNKSYLAFRCFFRILGMVFFFLNFFFGTKYNLFKKRFPERYLFSRILRPFF